ncbi:lysophospholipid acyltransferase family protein [Rhodopila sp.]|uniref:lysophospholipid acyltransferase family protein n=1 Tax=Rhodopila sp. TaxID=2480087 RepID=UPI003D0CCE0C
MRLRQHDPLTERSPVLVLLFGWYLRWYFHRRFHAVSVSRAGLPQVPNDRKLIIYSNHPSWWDPALFILVAAKLLPERASYGPMEAHQLQRYGLLRRMGVFGINPTSARGAADFLKVGRHVLEDPRRALWITAEGQFVDPRQRPVILRPGIAHLARHVPDVVFLPLAIEYAFWNESRPEALIRFGSPIEIAPRRDVTDTMAVLGAGLSATMDALARESMTRDPALFQPLVRGVAGVGGIYDMWRRIRAWASGQTFDAAHAPGSAQVPPPGQVTPYAPSPPTPRLAPHLGGQHR